MQTVDIDQAMTDLSRLVDEAVTGTPFIIAKAGKPLVKVTAVDEPERRLAPRRGFMIGQGKVPADFDGMFEKEIEQMFYAGE